MNEDKFKLPNGYKKIDQTESHIAHIGQGFYKRNDAGSLVMAFWIRPENGNSGGVAHGGMLMSIADYCLCSAAMESRENYAATVSFRHPTFAGAINSHLKLTVAA
jgi:acyl-coenzyme A thioesterase PaaI-like protein